MDDLNSNAKFTRIAYRYFGGIVEKYLLDYFHTLQTDISKANMRITAQEYLALALATATMVFVFELPIL